MSPRTASSEAVVAGFVPISAELLADAAFSDPIIERVWDQWANQLIFGEQWGQEQERLELGFAPAWDRREEDYYYCSECGRSCDC